MSRLSETRDPSFSPNFGDGPGRAGAGGKPSGLGRAAYSPTGRRISTPSCSNTTPEGSIVETTSGPTASPSWISSTLPSTAITAVRRFALGCQ